MVCTRRILLCVFVVSSAVAAALPTLSAVAPAIEVGDVVTSFHYQPSADFEGDVALHFVFDWGTSNPCQVFFGMSGVPSDAPLWGLVSSDRGEAYAMYYDYALRAHASNATFHPAVVLGEDNWSFGIFTFQEREGVEAFTVAGVGLTRWYSEEGALFENLYFQVACEHPFRIDALAGGDRVAGFSELGGTGTGAGAYSPALEGQLAVDDGVQVSMTEPLVGLTARAFTGDGPSAAAGAFSVDTPDESTSETSLEGLSVDLVGGPGEYGFAVTQAAAGPSTTLFALVVGLHPVGSVDELPRWTG